MLAKQMVEMGIELDASRTTLVDALGHGAAAVRHLAVAILGDSDVEFARPALDELKRLRGDHDPNVRRVAAEAVQRLSVR